MLAVTGGKGGVGKTTAALGVAAAAARAGRRPLVVDADLDLPDLAAVAGVDPGGLSTVAEGGSLDDPPSAAGATVLGAGPGTAPETLGRTLARLDGVDRPVFVDCPAGSGAVHCRALAAASGALLVTRPTRRAVADAVKADAMARRLGTPPRGVALAAAESAPGGDLPAAFPPAVAVPPPSVDPAWRATPGAYERLLSLV